MSLVKRRSYWGYALLLPPFLFSLLILVVPLCTLVLMSFWSQHGTTLDNTLTLANYQSFFTSSYSQLLLKTIKIASLVTLLTVLTAYPIAYFIAFHVKRNKALWLIVATAPFWTS